MIHVKPVPKLNDIVLKLKQNILLPPVVIEETGGALKIFFWQHVATTSGISAHFWYQYRTMDGHFIFVTTGGILPDCLDSNYVEIGEIFMKHNSKLN